MSGEWLMVSCANSVFPNLFIGGVFKAGTTSLFSYLASHGDIGVSSKKELGYFVPIQFGGSPAPLDEYLSYFKQLKGSHFRYVMEASPGYLYGGSKVAKAMNDLLGEFKIIFILREPVERLISFYNYLKNSYIFAYSERLLPKQKQFIKDMSFDEYVVQSYSYYKELKEDQSCEYYLSGVKYGLYYKYLLSWFDFVDSENIKIIFFDDLKFDPKKTLIDICEWLKISSDIYKDYQFLINNKTINVKYQLLHQLATGVNRKFEVFLRRSPRLKDKLRSVYNMVNAEIPDASRRIVDPVVISCFRRDLSNLKKLLTNYEYVNLPEWL